jgi:HD-like signal output (HDOD) protein
MRSLDQWVRALGGYDLPVLRRTVQAMAELRGREDSATARDVAELALHDPFMTVKVLRFSQSRLTIRQPTEVTTVEHAIMMHGVASFFAQFRELRCLEEVLAAHPIALDGALAVASRAHHAAVNARNFSALRHDVEIEEVLISALLHDLAEMLLWYAAPELAVQIQQMVLCNRGLRSASAQRAVLGFALGDLQLALAREWRLPKLLQDLMNDRRAGNPRVQAVQLSVSLARHAAHGWHDPALPDDYAGLRKLAGLAADQARRWVRQSALQAARNWRDFGIRPAAAWLPMLPGEWPVDDAAIQAVEPGANEAILARVLDQLGSARPGSADAGAVLALVFYGLQAGLGLRRLWYGAVDPAANAVEPRQSLSLDEGLAAEELAFELGSSHLFGRLMERAQGVWYGAHNRDRLAALLPGPVRDGVGERDFFAVSMFVKRMPHGLLYADAGNRGGALDEKRYNAFRRIGTAAARALERVAA